MLGVDVAKLEDEIFSIVNAVEFGSESLDFRVYGFTESDARTLSRLRALQTIRRDILTLASPPDVDLPENDTPAAQL